MSYPAFLTPDTLEGALECSGLDIPAHLFRYVVGALAELTVARNWELHGTVTPEEAADYFNELLLSTQWGLCTMPAMHERILVTNLSVEHNTTTLVQMGVGSLDTEYLSYDEGIITAGVNLWVVVTAVADFAANTTGVRRLIIRRDSTDVAKVQLPPAGAGVTGVPVSWSGALQAGETLRYYVLQTSGGSLNLNGQGITRWAITGFRTS